jgi:membrane protease YdiL (CAAX protease family)
MPSEQQAERQASSGNWWLGRDGLVRPIWRALLFVLAAGLLLPVAIVLLGDVLKLLSLGPVVGPRSSPPSARVLMPVYVVANAVLLLVSWVFLRVLDQRSFQALGLWFHTGWARELALGIALGGGLVVVVVALLAGAGWVRYHGWAGDASAGILEMARLAVFVGLAAGFEELIFRGYPFQRLVDSVGPLVALLAFSALFGAAHLRNPAATPLSTANTILSGVLLALTYLKARALWLPLGLHWAWNFLMGPVFALPVSGYWFRPPLFRVEISGPAWLSGGNYGPEGSAILTVVSVIAIVWTWRTKALSPPT